MGGGKRKYPTRAKYKPREMLKVEEDNKPKNPEDLKDIISLWKHLKKK